MESNLLNSQRGNEQDFNLKEWHLRARIGKENTSSRRYSASYIRSFREDSSRSFRSNFTISSTASSPGYHNKDEIDPSTYSFTRALKALQARSGYVWECLSPDGFALNSKWDEAERYICNPLSGEVPMECLSAKTLSGRSFRSYMASRVTMSAPLVYSVKPRRVINNPPKPISMVINKEQLTVPQCQEKRQMGCKITRDVGTQSTPPPAPEESTSSTSPAASTPSIKERSIKRCEDIEDQYEVVKNLRSKTKFKTLEEVEVKITREGDDTKRGTKEGAQKKKRFKSGQLCSCRQLNGCSLLSYWRCLWMKRRHQENHVQTRSRMIA